MKVEVAVLGSPFLILRTASGRKATLNFRYMSSGPDIAFMVDCRQYQWINYLSNYTCGMLAARAAY